MRETKMIGIISFASAVALALAIFKLGTAPQCAEAQEQIRKQYSNCGVIMDEPDDWVVFVLQNGHEFAFENEDHDWLVGDLVSVIFDDMGTEAITDDTIVDVRYAGYISPEEIDNWIK